MAFKEKEDFFGLADDKLVCTASNDGASASVVEAKGADGAIVAHEVYGETIAPSCDYLPKGEWSRGSESPQPKPIELGDVHGTTKKVCLASFSINTGTGVAPTVSASGEQVADDAVKGCTFKIPAFTLPKTHHAHILWNCLTLGGAGVHLTQANYAGTCSVTKAVKEGKVLTHDVVEGKIEASVTFVQTGAAAPTVTPGEGWSVTGPLACTNPDADYPTWAATLTMYLQKA